MAGDAFEESEMHDGAPIVRRDKVVSRGMTGLFFGSGGLTILVAIFTAFANSSAARPMPDAGLAMFVALMMAFGVAMGIAGIIFGVLRTVVTKKAVHVKYGFWGPTVPLEAIESVRAIEYDWKEFGGWGMKIGKGGARAYVPRNGPCLELVYREGDQKKRVVVGQENASATAQAINEARRGAHIRVADDEAERALEEAAEDEAALGEQKSSATR